MLLSFWNLYAFLQLLHFLQSNCPIRDLLLSWSPTTREINRYPLLRVKVRCEIGIWNKLEPFVGSSILNSVFFSRTYT
ncbi:hypothetical protein B0H34DRAFT_715076 [Crassisporium funariophilum]|nr:hypothetical protein B0H34DRAFT_715076 [Crassisporium funariophilum]